MNGRNHNLIKTENYNHDQSLIEATRQDRIPRINIYRSPVTAVILGRGSKPEVELNIDACQEDEIPILKRPGGGCAVLIDPGNIVIALVLPTEGIAGNKEYFNRITKLLLDQLKAIGIENIYHDGISDFVIDDRKVGGSCIHRSKDHLYYSATLLIEPRLDLIERYIQHPPREPEYRRGRKHAEFLSTITLRNSESPASDLVASLRQSMKYVDLHSLV